MDWALGGVARPVEVALGSGRVLRPVEIAAVLGFDLPRLVALRAEDDEPRFSHVPELEHAEKEVQSTPPNEGARDHVLPSAINRRVAVHIEREEADESVPHALRAEVLEDFELIHEQRPLALASCDARW